ncbi:MAG: hypothetical protein K2X35_00120 [Bryobacteraceae bacterium]|nr:hypothetical protein [Bryobacteraceae bacterium]
MSSQPIFPNDAFEQQLRHFVENRQDVRRKSPERARGASRSSTAFHAVLPLHAPPVKRLENRAAELKWVRENAATYAGQWVALDGDRVVSLGPDARTVYEEARKHIDGIPFVVHLKADHLPFAGW